MDKHTKASPASLSWLAEMTGGAFGKMIDFSQVILDPEARLRFKDRQAGIRQDVTRRPFVQFKKPELSEAAQQALMARRSHRRFLTQPIAFDTFGRFLQALRQFNVGGEAKHGYGSAGGAYPVQVYLHVQPSRVEGVPPGIYYYHPVTHRLCALAEDVLLDSSLHFQTNRFIAAEAAFSIFLIGEPEAIVPLYGDKARDFCLIEAGLMAQLLESEGPPHGIGVCQIGLIDFEAIRHYFRLEERHFLIHTMVGGLIGEEPSEVEAPTATAVVATERASQEQHPPQVVHLPAPNSATLAQIEAGLVRMWREVLGSEHIDVHQQFFDMGGTSLHAVQLIRRVQETYPYQVEVGDLFSYPTIYGLARFLAEKMAATTVATPTLSQFPLPPGRDQDEGTRVHPVEGDSLTLAISQGPQHGSHFSSPLEGEDTGGGENRVTSHPRPPPPPSRGRGTRLMEAIAIVAMAGRFPDAANLESLWQNLEAGVRSVGPLPPARAALIDEFQPYPAQAYRGSYLSDIECFDPLFFHISHKEARRMDPAQRLLLETCYELIERAGYAGGQLAGSRTGVFVGAGSSEYWRSLARYVSVDDLTRLITGNMPSILANRISHVLDLRGPSIAIDTACSSSLVAVDAACRSILTGDCDTAIAASVNLLLSPATFEAFRQDGMEANGGQCRTFDAGADGFVRGEGVAAILLKPLAQAISDRDTILAVIRGSATNHDGSTNALAVPNPLTQEAVISLALRRAGMSAESISYVEAHGTATALGDPIEVSGLTQAFRAATEQRMFCGIGSLKTNLGHLEYMAGLAGLIKIVLAFGHRRLPPSLHFETPNPYIDFANSPFYVIDRAREWISDARPRRAAVSSFGVGGTNAHVVIEEPPAVSVERPAANSPVHLLALSARSQPALARLMASYLDYLGGPRVADLGDLCFTANTGRQHFGHRLALLARYPDQLADKLYIAVLAPGDEQRLRASLIFPGAPRESSAWSEAERRQWRDMVARLPANAAGWLARWCSGALFEAEVRALLPVGTAADPDLNSEEWVQCLSALAQFYAWGGEVDWHGVEAGFVRRRVPLPTYPFERERLWIQRSIDTPPVQLPASPPRPALEKCLEARQALLRDHRIGKAPVVPGAFYLDFALAAAQDAVGTPVHSLHRVIFSRPLVMAPEGQVWIRAEHDAAHAETVTLRFLGTDRPPTARHDASWTEYATVEASLELQQTPRSVDLDAFRARCQEELPAEAIYQWFERLGLTYGPTLQTLRTVRRGAAEIVAEIALPPSEASSGGFFHLHPALLDGALQSLVCIAFRQDEAAVEHFLPYQIDEVQVYGPVQEAIVSHSRLMAVSPDRPQIARGEITIADRSGRVLVELKGVVLRRAEITMPAQPRTVQHAPAAEVSVADVRAYLVASIGKALEIPVERIDAQQPLVEMGMDSMTALALLEDLQKHTATPISPAFFFAHPTIQQLAEALVAEHQLDLAGEAPWLAAEVPVAVEATRTAAQVRGTLLPVQSTNGGELAERAIAIIGMAGRFPQARNLREFWHNLRHGRDAITEVPGARWDVSRMFNPDPEAVGSTYGKWGGFLEDIDQFDPLLFRIADREAKWMDPQQRLLLETVWEMLETAGYGGTALFGSRTGVYVGASYNHVRDDMSRRGAQLLHAHASLGNHNAILANRVSYFFNLHGPCLTVDTLCSSSLVALHLAVGALRRGECDCALVAGVHVGMSSIYFEALSRLQAISPVGKCKTFDRGADGYVPGEGVGVVLLKPLRTALADRDQIHGIIRGTAVNHGGQAAGLTVPNPTAQADVIRYALRDADIPANSLSYVEVHGTGTALGDPIEIMGLTQVFREADGCGQYCAIGSVKTNIGHLEPAAGLAGLLKVVLAMQAGELPPSLHLHEPNPKIQFENSPFYAVDRLQQWAPRSGVRRAGVSSFGLGGVNAHVVVEEGGPVSVERPAADRPAHILTLSARSRKTLLRLADAFRGYLEGMDEADVRDVCFTANTGRAHLGHRLAVIVRNTDELREKLGLLVAADNAQDLENALVFIGAPAAARALPPPARRAVEEQLNQLSDHAAERLLGWVKGRLVEEGLRPYRVAKDGSSQSPDLHRETDDCIPVLMLLSRLYVLGSEIDWQAVEAGLIRRRIWLPPYPFERTRLGLDTALFAPAPQDQSGPKSQAVHPLLVGSVQRGSQHSRHFEADIVLDSQ